MDLLGCGPSLGPHVLSPSPDPSLLHLGVGIWWEGADVTGLCILTTSLGPGEGGPASPEAGFVSLTPLEYEYPEGRGGRSSTSSPAKVPTALGNTGGNVGVSSEIQNQKTERPLGIF